MFVILSVGRDRSVRRDIIEYIDGQDSRPSNLEIRCWLLDSNIRIGCPTGNRYALSNTECKAAG